MVAASSDITARPGFVKPPPGVNDLYRRYSETVFRAALRVLGNAADAEDVLQSVFLRMISNSLTVDGTGAPEPYLRRAAINASIDLLRRKSSLAEIAIDESREYGSREDKVLLKERLRRALAKISPEDGELFVLCYLEGYSYDELAKQFRVERGTISSRLHRIRGVLQGHLSK